LAILVTPFGLFKTFFSNHNIHVTNPVISHAWRKNRIVMMTNSTYPWHVILSYG
jgi:hypothetical protein